MMASIPITTMSTIIGAAVVNASRRCTPYLVDCAVCVANFASYFVSVVMTAARVHGQRRQGGHAPNVNETGGGDILNRTLLSAKYW